MLWQVLREFETASAPIDLNELSRRLNIDRSALDGMIQFWVQKGRLVDDAGSAQATTACAANACGSHCASAQHCPFTMKLPRTISLVSPTRD